MPQANKNWMAERKWPQGHIFDTTVLTIAAHTEFHVRHMHFFQHSYPLCHNEVTLLFVEARQDSREIYSAWIWEKGKSLRRNHISYFTRLVCCTKGGWLLVYTVQMKLYWLFICRKNGPLKKESQAWKTKWRSVSLCKSGAYFASQVVLSDQLI